MPMTSTHIRSRSKAQRHASPESPESPESPTNRKAPLTKRARKPAIKSAIKSAIKTPATAVRKSTNTRNDAHSNESIGEVLSRLARAIPAPQCELTFDNPWQLMIKAILSAQSTDKLVNRIGPALFERWPTPASLGAATQEEVETAIMSTGFFRMKAKAIRETSKMVAEEHGGVVPCDFDALMKLRGVARKTANVVMGTGYGVETGVVVDTHMMRVSQRLGFTDKKDPVQIEKKLVTLFPKGTWIDQSHRFVLHGRYVCIAKKPKCFTCPLNELCPSKQQPAVGTWQQRADHEKRIVDTQGKWQPEAPSIC